MSWGAASSLDSHMEKNDIEALREAGCDSNDTLIAKGVCIDKDYDLRTPPDQNEIPIWNQGIFITFLDYDVLQIDETKETLQMDVKISFWWRDDRIKTNPSLFKTFSRNVGLASGVTIMWSDDMPWNKMIWSPKGIQFNHTYKSHLIYEPATYLHIAPGESILRNNATLARNTTSLCYLKHYNLGINCKFKFFNFPMDSHKCSLQLTNRFIRELKLSLYDLKIKKLASNPTNNLKRDGFDIRISYEENNATRNSDVISSVYLHLNLERMLYPYISKYYFPSIVIVCISQVSFIIPPSSIPGRLGLVATLFLTMTNILIDSNVSKNMNMFIRHP